MSRIEVTRKVDTVFVEMDLSVAQKLQALLASATDATGEPWDLVRLMNKLAVQEVSAGIYHGQGELRVRVHPMFGGKK